MLDASETNEAPVTAPVSSPETGDNTSAVPPADTTASHDSVDTAPYVPRRALEDERKKRQDLKRRLDDLERSAQSVQQQQPQRHPQQITAEDIERLWWENPAQAAVIVQQMAAQNATVHAERMMLSRELDRSERRARKAHGDEIVAQALEQAKMAGRVQSFLDEDDPYQSLVDWYFETEVLRDPASAREKIEAEILAKYGITQAAQPKPAARAAVPKSLASRTSEMPRNDRGQFQGRASLDELLG